MGLMHWLGRLLPGERQRTADELGLHKEHAHQTCLNCGSELYGPFCTVCGQRDDDFRRPFLQLGNEFFSDMFQWDSRILRSAIPFIFMPGTMTRAFIAGRRGHYVSPLRLYFFVSVFFFLALGLSDVALIKFEVRGVNSFLAKQAEENDRAGRRPPQQPNVTIPEDAIPPDTGIPEVDDLRDRIAERQNADPDDTDDSVSSDETDDANEPEDVGGSEEAASPAPDESEGEAQDDAEEDAGSVDGDNTDNSDAEADAAPDETPSETTPPQQPETSEPDGSPDGTGNETSDDDEKEQFNIRMFTVVSEDDQPNDQIPPEVIERLAGDGDDASNKLVRQFLVAANIALQRPQVFNNILNVWLPRVMIVLVPLVAFVLTILYGRRKRLKQPVYYIDSLVFSLNFHSFIFFLMLIMVLKAQFVGDVINGESMALFFFLAITLYLYAGMKTVYQQGYIKTTIKFVFLALFLFITYFSVLLGITVYGLIDQANNAQAAGMVG